MDPPVEDDRAPDVDIPNPYVLLRSAGLRPRKGLGQHFLVDREILGRIVEAADVAPDDVVVEIGPGLGVLTGALAARAGRVVAVEIDPAMAEILTTTLGDRRNLEIVVDDILRRPAADFAGLDAMRPHDSDDLPAPAVGEWRVEPRFKVVANLPYYITSAVLRHVLEAPVKPARAVVMVQDEVAERMLAAPGRMSILGVAVQLFARPSLICRVPALAFVPPPSVGSAVVRLDVHPAPPVPVDDLGAFFAVVRAGFGQKRKQLRNSIAAGLDLSTADAAAALDAAGIDPRRRAETVTLAEWSALTFAVALAHDVDPEAARDEG